jgi:hypothetical protein
MDAGSDALSRYKCFNKGLYYTPEIRRAQLMQAFRRLSALTPELGCRTMDILHVACACQLEPDWFISFDNRQKSLAEQAGLTVMDLNG